MQIITGRTGEPHIYASDDAELYKLFLGDGDFCLMTGNRLALNRISPTVVNISDGSLIMQGRLAKIRPTDGYDTLTLDNGTQGDKRMDLIVAEYNQRITEKQVEQGGQIVTVEDKIESVELKIVKGTPNKSQYVEPSIITGNIDLGETHQMVLYAVKLDGIDSGGIEDRRVFLDTTPIQSAISYARGSINTIRAELDELGADVYQYADSLREGISQGFKGCWKAKVSATGSEGGVFAPINMPSSYQYSSGDNIDVYLNGLKLTTDEYATSFTSSGEIGITLSDPLKTFAGTMEVIATRVTTE